MIFTCDVVLLCGVLPCPIILSHTIITLVMKWSDVRATAELRVCQCFDSLRLASYLTLIIFIFDYLSTPPTCNVVYSARSAAHIPTEPYVRKLLSWGEGGGWRRQGSRKAGSMTPGLRNLDCICFVSWLLRIFCLPSSKFFFLYLLQNWDFKIKRDTPQNTVVATDKG